MKDYRAINPQLSGMSRKQLEKIYISYAKNINKRLRVIEKSGKYQETINLRKGNIAGYLLQSGNVSKAVSNKSEYELRKGIMDLGYFLSLKTTSLTGLRKQEKERRKFFIEDERFPNINENNIDLFLEFLESEAYKELEEMYSSDIIFEEFQNIQNTEGLTASKLVETFKVWEEKKYHKSVNEILKGMYKLENR